MNMKNVIISIGAFSAQQVIDTLQAGRSVVAYDPRRAMCEAYSEIRDPNFKWFPFAVSGEAGRAAFYEHGGSSTVLPMTDCPFKIDDTYDVEVVSMRSVLSEYPEVQHLTMNCEGSEVSIILDTPIELLARCRGVGVEFHRFCEYLSVTNEDVRRCIDKLSGRFRHRVTDPGPPYVVFDRMR